MIFGERVADQGELGSLEGLGLGLALLESKVEAGHQLLGGAVVYLPEGSDRSFCTAILELVAESENFFSISSEVAAESGFAGTKNDQIKVVEFPIFNIL